MLFRDSPEQARFRAELRNFLDQELPSIEWDMRNDREEMDEDEGRQSSISEMWKGR